VRRLVALLAATLALALTSTAGADTFRVVPHHGSGGGSVAFSSTGAVIPFTAAQKAQTGPMPFAVLRGIWQAAGNTYGIPWSVLAAINKVETNFGQNLGPSSAGAIGWMQFMPSTWARWGIDANGDGVADPNNPTDAIFSASRYLAGCGGQFNIAAAVYCYNHATWYVNDVLGLAAVYGRGGGAVDLLSASELQKQIDAARQRVAASNSQLLAARAQALKLARAQRVAVHRAADASLLSNQLEAQKRAVLVGVRHNAAVMRISRLRELLHAATTKLGQVQAGASGPSYVTSAGQLLSMPLSGQGGVVSLAVQYLGVPYVWAGASPTGFDCSGLVQYVFGQLGVSLPHNAAAQWNDPAAISVPRNQLQPGDLVFFNGLDHVGIYIGHGDFIDAPHTGAFVRIDSLRDDWYTANYDGAKRIVGTALASLPQAGGTVSFSMAGGAAFTSNIVYFTR
jgi:cell wall-associated NlpC family hydrolase